MGLWAAAPLLLTVALLTGGCGDGPSGAGLLIDPARVEVAAAGFQEGQPHKAGVTHPRGQ